MFKKIAGVFCLILGIFFSIATIKMIFVDNPKTKSVLKDAVYVGEDAIDEKNDGKIVIVCGTFELTKPAYDDEIGISFDNIRVSRSKQTMKLNKGSSQKDEEDMTATEKLYGVLEWSPVMGSVAYQGEGKIGNYTLSSDFIENIRTDTVWAKYDEEELQEAGYAYMPDKKHSPTHFIEPLEQCQRALKENDFRYNYSAAGLKTGQKVTAIGIQDGQTLKAAPKMADSVMKGTLDKKEAIKKGGTGGVGVTIFSICFALFWLVVGMRLIIVKKK